MFARSEGAAASYYLTDALGSTLALTDAAGAVQTQYTYEPFGNTTQSGAENNSAFQYTGRENDGTGLYYYRVRYFNPTTQRFISQDPIGFAGGDVNLYAYVGGNPVTRVDPLGLWSVNMSFYWGGGGSISFGSDGGKSFVEIGAGVGVGGGIKIYPNGSFPGSRGGELCGNRGFLGASGSIDGTFGPFSAELKGEAGGLISQGSDGRTKLEYVEQGGFDWSLRGSDGWGLRLGAGLNIIDAAVSW